MKRIWKYPLDVTDEQGITMPDGAVILTVQTQNEKPCLWAIVDPLAPHRIRRFAMIGTGNPADVLDVIPGPHYVGTFQLMGGGLVFHVFEIP